MNVTLRALCPDDLSSIQAWSRDRDFCLANGWDTDLSPEAVAAWWSPLLAPSKPDASLSRLGIEVGGELVGYADLAKLSPGVASFGIAIGARGRWGKGLGTRAAQLMLAYGFDTLGLRRIDAEVHTGNLRSLALMQRLGFRECGRQPASEQYMGHFGDEILFGLERGDWAAQGPASGLN